MAYDLLDHLTQWYVSSTNQEQYLYDASGERVLRRFTNSSSSTILTFPFGIEEHKYTGSGTSQSDTYYYTLAGRLLGSLDSNGTQFYLTDALGNLISDFTNAGGGAQLKSNELFGPYGNNRYFAGSSNTAKGFLSQYKDGTGLNYLHARYFDPVVGVFLSADKIQGNLQAMNPYAYVGGNPETRSDPTGQMFANPASAGGGGGPVATTNTTTGTTSQRPVTPHSSCFIICGAMTVATTAVHVALTVVDLATGFSSMVGDVQTLFNSNASVWDKIGAGADLLLNVGLDVSMVLGVGEALRIGDLALRAGIDIGEHIVESEGTSTLEKVAEHAVEACQGLSFAPATLVATALGERAIGKLHIGDKVWAYNPRTHKMELERVLHVWINHDHDLVDLTVTRTTHTQHGKTIQKSEVLHTNKKHPFLTREKGFLSVGQLKLGMHLLEADGKYGVVTGWKLVPGAAVMYNLEVAQDHTYTVGVGQWVVHNCGGGLTLRDGTEVSIPDKGFDHSFDSHAAEWFGRSVTSADKPAWGNLINRAMNSSKIVPWALKGRETIGVFARLPYYDEMRPFLVQFYRDTGELATAFKPSADQLNGIYQLLGIQ